MQKRRIEEIHTHPTFESLFPINPALLEKIEQDMRQGTYDLSQPIVLATWEGQPEPVCIDGHTRLRAAISVGIEEVPVWLHEFNTEDEALEKAIKLQRNRRNMTDAEILTCIEVLDKKRARGGDRRSEARKSIPQSCGIENGRNSSAKETGEMFGISERKVEQIRTVMEHADEATKEAVKQGDLSINQAYETTQKKRREKKAKSENVARNSNQEVTEDLEKQEPMLPTLDSQVFAPVFISMDRYKSLFDLGGSIEDRLASAVDLYLESLRPEYRGLSGETARDHGKEDTSESEYDDGDEYFNPEDYDEE